MKRLFLSVGVLLSVLCSCATPPAAGESDSKAAVLNFAHGLEMKDIDLLMSSYHDDADFIFTDPDGNSQLIEGAAAIREGQAPGLQEVKYRALMDSLTVEETGDGYTYTILIDLNDGAIAFLNTLELVFKNGKWGIQHQKVGFPE